MKGILIILDGAADLPLEKLGNKTPLEVAKMPNLDFLASRSKLGYMYSVKQGFIPESDEAIVSIFGNDLISSTRGQLEARGLGIKPTRGDLVLRANFATIESLDTGIILDRRAGRTLSTYEAKILEKTINKEVKLPCNFLFKVGIGHRAVLILKGGFSDNISGNDTSIYVQGKTILSDKISRCKPLDDEDNSLYSANIVNEFLEKAYNLLKDHPINIERKKKGLLPANFILLRGPGIESPKLKYYKKWVSAAYMPLEIGFSKVSGMKTFNFKYPELRNIDVYANLYEGLKKACKFSFWVLKKNLKKSDYLYIHIKETDIPGHDNKPFEKIQMLELIDKLLFSRLNQVIFPNHLRVLISCDHSTPCKNKAHSADPVPVLYYNGNYSEIKSQKFSEKDSKKGELGNIDTGKELFKKTNFL